MRKLLGLIILCCLLVPAFAFAEDIYVAQTSAGSDTGADCANAHSITWANTADKWGDGDDKVSAGDTVHLCGTLSTNLTIQGSGSSGSPVIILFESGAKFSKDVWGDISNSAIYSSDKSYITIDGGTNGLIESTDNGTEKTNSNPSVGIYKSGGTNWEIKNITIGPMYVRVYGNDCRPRNSGEADQTNLIVLLGINAVSVHDNILYHGETGIAAVWNDGDGTYSVYNNTITHVANGTTTYPGSSEANFTLSKYDNYNNTVTITKDWGGNACLHDDYLQVDVFASTITELNIFNNNSVGNSDCENDGSSNSHMLLQATSGGVYTELNIYNNILYSECSLSNPFINASNCEGAVIANNTIIGSGSGSGCMQVASASMIVKNNICYSTGYAIVAYGSIDTSSVDYNIYYPDSMQFYEPSGTPNSGIITYAQWKQNHATFDANSSQNQPILGASFVLASNDTIARSHGADLSATFTTDKNGATRTVPWDIGAYKFDTTGQLLPVRASGVTISGGSW